MLAYIHSSYRLRNEREDCVKFETDAIVSE
jgi:hypothetical protein